MTEMDLLRIREELHRLSLMAEGWSVPDAVTALERDLALGKLRELYDILLFAEPRAIVPAEMSDSTDVAMNISLDEVLLTVEPPVAAMPEPEIRNSFEPESPETVPETVVAAMPEPVAVPEPEPVVMTPASDHSELPDAESAARPEVVRPTSDAEPAQLFEPALFGDDEIQRHKRKQRVIMSLYGDAPAEKATPQPVAASSPVSEPFAGAAPELEIIVVETPEEPLSPADPVPAPEFEPGSDARDDSGADSESDSETGSEVAAVSVTSDTGAVLGEVINRGVQTLGESFVHSRSAVSEAAHLAHVDDLRAAIGINDRFLLVRDLFGGDAVACDAAIDRLNAFDDLDDCMLYIAENYAWNPNSDGAKLLVELLERKLI